MKNNFLKNNTKNLFFNLLLVFEEKYAWYEKFAFGENICYNVIDMLKNKGR